MKQGFIAFDDMGPRMCTRIRRSSNQISFPGWFGMLLLRGREYGF